MLTMRFGTSLIDLLHDGNEHKIAATDGNNQTKKYEYDKREHYQCIATQTVYFAITTIIGYIILKIFTPVEKQPQQTKEYVTKNGIIDKHTTGMRAIV